MSTLTYDNAPTARVGTPAAPAVAPQKGWFGRMVERMIEARQRQAMEEVRRYGIPLKGLDEQNAEEPR